MKIACIGAGYVGGPTMATIAERCPDISVTVFDISASRIAAWNSDTLPIYEPGLYEVVTKVRGRNLFFTTDDSAISDADIIFISVNTPTKNFGDGCGRAANLTYVEQCSRLIAKKVTIGHKVVVEKSTVPVRCSIAIRKILGGLRDVTKATFSIVSNPEFLAEGTAMDDLANPDRVLIGGEQDEAGNAAVELLASVYHRWVPDERIIRTSCWSSELAKLAANAFLAQRISSINSVSAICDATGANVTEVSCAIGRDSRIGAKFLQPSIGFGGSCFQKDILNLVYLCESLHLPEVAAYWNAVVMMNDYQRHRFARTIVRTMHGCIEGKSIAIFGFAFKKNTGDTRESSATAVCTSLLEEGAKLRIYDPKVPHATILNDLQEKISFQKYRTESARRDGQGSSFSLHRADGPSVDSCVTCCSSAMEASLLASAIVILTEWDEFRHDCCDYAAHYAQMERPSYVFDGRLMISTRDMAAIGFETYCIGMPLRASDSFPM